MITRKEVAALLTRCASSSSDQRTIGTADVEDWYEIAVMQHWSYPVARRIIVEYIGSGAGKPRITEAHITDRTKALRSAAAASFVLPVIPDGQHPSEYPAWHRAQLAAHIDQILAQWVATGTEPDAGAPAPQIMPNPEGQARVRQIIGGAFRPVPAGTTPADALPPIQPRTEVTVPCPFCGAPAGRPCTRSSGATKQVPLRKVHPARAEAAA
jgi:hypothetical protein